MNIKTTIGALSLVAVMALTTGCGSSSSSTPTETKKVTAVQKTAVLTTYADIALANYTDALKDAKSMVTAIKAFTDAPTEATLKTAKDSWKTARESYGTTEIFRLSNGPIDAEEGFAASWDAPEGQINAWPLDENMIDYTTDANGDTTTGNIIDSTGSFKPSGIDATAVDVTTITKETIAALNENGGDANVASGFHALEFLLWGQDQDYNDFVADAVTQGATVAGMREASDYGTATHADRRVAYVNATAELIVDDLTKMVDAWSVKDKSYREAFLGKGENKIGTDTALKQVLAGMGVFIKSELANERMAVAILTPSEEDEHSCFADNTHRDVDRNYRGFVNALKGEYLGKSKGTSLYSLLSADEQKELDLLISDIDTKMTKMNEAVVVENFDYQIKDGSVNRANLKNMKNELRDLGDEIVDVAKEFGISLSGSDVTDPDETKI